MSEEHFVLSLHNMFMTVGHVVYVFTRYLYAWNAMLCLAFCCRAVTRVTMSCAIFYAFVMVLACICMPEGHFVCNFEWILVVCEMQCMFFCKVFVSPEGSFWHFAADEWPG